ncbi:MAG: HAD family hydrolase [Planctomycetota bacterium]|nr:MAG: HAD family hydrolase [Planctomycetota bacterium]
MGINAGKAVKMKKSSTQKMKTTKLTPYTESTIDRQLWTREPQKWIYANRDLRLDKIKAIGFDMDFTLAIYKDHHFQKLTYLATLEKLVNQKGYPPKILEFQYDPHSVIRGIVMDRDAGTLFKLDEHYYVGRVMKNGKIVSKEERHRLYGGKKIPLGSPQFHWLDTLFEIPEANLYMQLLSFFENRLDKERFPSNRIFYDIRECMDASHQDKEVKGKIIANPHHYIEVDPLLPITLHRFRSVGKELFLLTNSNWEFTNKVMSFLLPPGHFGYQSWIQYFDLIVVSAQKPLFFKNGHPFEKPNLSGLPEEWHKKIFQGGNIELLQQFLRLGGEDILYIGDHIYGDILRSKKDTLWRTCMIIPELEQEIAIIREKRDLFHKYWELETQRKHLDEEINYHRMVKMFLSKKNGDPASHELLSQCQNHSHILQKNLSRCLNEIRKIENQIAQFFNPYWGLLMREDNEKSLFGDQVEHYAGLYTSRVSNFCFYSPLQYFRASVDLMPHELVI